MPQKLHHPLHLYCDNTWYFLSAGVYQKQPIMANDLRKSELRDLLKDVYSKFGFKIKAWVILNNHYHILFKTNKGNDIPKLIQKIHGSTSYKWNLEDKESGRKIWQNYWDYCPKDEKDIGMHFNYIHHNPVKHGYVKQMEDWQYSSFQYYLRKYGMEWIMSWFETYPIIDFSLSWKD